MIFDFLMLGGLYTVHVTEIRHTVHVHSLHVGLHVYTLYVK